MFIARNIKVDRNYYIYLFGSCIWLHFELGKDLDFKSADQPWVNERALYVKLSILRRMQYICMHSKTI